MLTHWYGSYTAMYHMACYGLLTVIPWWWSCRNVHYSLRILVAPQSKYVHWSRHAGTQHSQQNRTCLTCPSQKRDRQKINWFGLGNSSIEKIILKSGLNPTLSMGNGQKNFFAIPRHDLCHTRWLHASLLLQLQLQ